MGVTGLPGAWRWLVVVSLLVWLLLIGNASLIESSRPFDSGIRTMLMDGHLGVSWVQPGGPAWDEGVRPGDEVVAIDATPPPPEAPVRLLSGQQVELRSATRGQWTLALAPSPVLSSNIERVAFVSIAACFAALGGAVFLMSTSLRQAAAFLGLGVTTASVLIASLAAPFGSAWALALVYVALLGAGTSALALALEFPAGRQPSPVRRGWSLASIAASACAAGLYGWVVLVDSAAYVLVERLWLAVVAIQLLAVVVLLARAVIRPSVEQAPGNRGIRLVALGCLAGLAPFSLLSMVPQAVGLEYILAPEQSIFSVALVPVTIAASRLGDQSPRLERLVYRGLLAVLVWVILLAGYSFVLIQLQPGIFDGWGVPRGAPRYTLVVTLVALSFPFLQARLRGILEHRFFPAVYGYAETLRSMTQAIARLHGTDAVAHGTLGRLARTLDLRWAAIVVRDDVHSDSSTYIVGSPPPSLDVALVLREADTASRIQTGSTRTLSAVTIGGEAWLVPLHAAEEGDIGAMLLGPKRRRTELSWTDLSLVVALAPVLAVALENGALVRRLRTSIGFLGARERELAALNNRLVHVQEEERRRLALDLHDEPLQRAILLARELDEPVSPSNRAQWRRRAQEIADSLRAIATGLRPPVLDDLGLVAALERLARDVRSRGDAEVSLQLVPREFFTSCRLALDLEVALYRVAQEALNNCLKHAAATEIQVTVELADDRVRMRIADNGRGYEPSLDGEDNRQAVGLGLLGMRERLRDWQGHVDVHPRPSGGAEVVAEVALVRATHP